MRTVAKRVLVTGGAVFLLAPLRQPAGTGRRVLCVDNYCTGRQGQHRASAHGAELRGERHDVTFRLFVEVDEIDNLACPAAGTTSSDPVQTNQDSVIGAILCGAGRSG